MKTLPRAATTKWWKMKIKKKRENSSWINAGICVIIIAIITVIGWWAPQIADYKFDRAIHSRYLCAHHTITNCVAIRIYTFSAVTVLDCKFLCAPRCSRLPRAHPKTAFQLKMWYYHLRITMEWFNFVFSFFCPVASLASECVLCFGYCLFNKLQTRNWTGENSIWMHCRLSLYPTAPMNYFITLVAAWLAALNENANIIPSTDGISSYYLYSKWRKIEFATWTLPFGFRGTKPCIQLPTLRKNVFI